jgi:hypothetical protein
MTPTTPALMLEAALAAHDAGLCVIRGRTDGSKRPLGAWKEFQAQRPDRDDVIEAFADNHPALMVVCGVVSGGLEMLELEGRAVADGLDDRIDARARELGVIDILERVVLGYCERTPSNGLHLLYRCDAIDGNLKLARRPASAAELAENPDDQIKTLIETRGEGGVVMVAPSHGPTHGTGQPWEITDGGFDRIATITIEERQALLALMAEFDESGEQPAAIVEPVAPKPVTRWNGGAVGPSWFDSVVEHLEHEMTMRSRLERYGWTVVGTDQRGDLVCRPGKTDGISGRINTNGRLMNWSTSAPFECASPITRPTFDQLNVIAAYEHQGDRQAAGRAVAERTGILTLWKAQHDNSDSPVKGAQKGAGATQPAPTGMNLPDTFWASRPELAHIRQAAHSRQRSADAVLACILARVAAFTPPCWHLPAVVGAESSLATYVVLVGPSGAGKSSAKDAAMDVLPVNLQSVADDLPLGSGEGLIEAYFDLTDEDKPGGKGTQKVKRKVRDGAYLTLDEGQALADLGARKGSTLVTNLRSAWTGATLGNTNASAETKRKVAKGTYTLGLVIGLQPVLANALLDDSGGGLPQRFAWFTVTDPSIPDERIEWPGPLPWTPLPVVRHGGGLSADAEIERVIRTNDLQRQRGAEFDPLDSHADLVRFKLAGCLAVLAGRTNITVDDWSLAGTIWRTGRLIRTVVKEQIAIEGRKVEASRTAAAVRREEAISTSAADQAIKAMAKNIATAVRRHAQSSCPDGCSKRCAHASTASKHRQLATIDEALEHAARAELIAWKGERLLPGKVVPA